LGDSLASGLSGNYALRAACYTYGRFARFIEEATMPDPRRSRPVTALRNYAAAALLNLALVSTTLVPPDRSRAAQTRIVTVASPFHPTEVADLGAGERGILSMPYVSGGLAAPVADH